MIQAESAANTIAPTGTDASGVFRPVLTLVEKGIETALNLVGVGVWEHLLPENQVICSDGIYQLVGVEPAVGRLQQTFWPSRVHPDDVAAQDLAFQDFLQGSDAVYEEIYRVRHEAGHYITVLARARWVARNDGSGGRCS